MVGDRMRFLTKKWLGDVKCDHKGRAVLIAATLTIIERVLLPERPGFIVTAAQPNAGKTTVLKMIMMAATGTTGAAAGWSNTQVGHREAGSC
jgi:hypothetical protein